MGIGIDFHGFNLPSPFAYEFLQENVEGTGGELQDGDSELSSRAMSM